MSYLQTINDFLQESEGNGIQLKDEEREVLKGIVRRGRSERRFVDRARILLWSEQGASVGDISRRLGLDRNTVVYWRVRFLQNRDSGIPKCLEDFPRPGRPRIPKVRAPKQAL
jgi:transposase-like protein